MTNKQPKKVLVRSGNVISRFSPGNYVPLPPIPSWTRVITVGIDKPESANLFLADVFPQALRTLGFKAVLIKKMASFALPVDGQTPILTMIPGVAGFNPQFRACAQTAGGGASVGCNIPTDYQGPYSESDKVLVNLDCPVSPVYFRVWVVLLP